MNTYRMSIAWPRIVPDGVGAINQAGIAHYQQLFAKLTDAGEYLLLCCGCIRVWNVVNWSLPPVDTQDARRLPRLSLPTATAPPHLRVRKRACVPVCLRVPALHAGP